MAVFQCRYMFLWKLQLFTPASPTPTAASTFSHSASFCLFVGHCSYFVQAYSLHWTECNHKSAAFLCLSGLYMQKSCRKCSFASLIMFLTPLSICLFQQCLYFLFSLKHLQEYWFVVRVRFASWALFLFCPRSKAQEQLQQQLQGPEEQLSPAEE